MPGWVRLAGRASAAATAVLFAALGYTWVTLPDVRGLATDNPTTTAFMQLRADEARAEGRTPRARFQWVPYRRISPSLILAVRLTEDAAFFSHDGIDYDELRAALEARWERGGPLRGASTITQQLAKNLYLSPSRSLTRKLTELLITRRLEAELSKRRILEIYLNVIEWGDGIWGVQAAAESYFGVPAAGLNDPQAALLAGAIINPHLYNPARPNAYLLRRQSTILGRMAHARRPLPAP